MKDFEISIIKFLRNLSTPFLDNLLQVITFLGEQYALIAILAVIYFIIDKEKGQTIAYALFTSLGLNGAIKGIVKYERPFVYDDTYEAVRKETATGYSFPSGHTQNSSVTYMSLARVFKKKYLYITVSIIIFLIGFSRIALGVHFPKDVIVGCFLGIGCSFLCTFLHQKYATNLKNKMIMYFSTFIIFLPFVFIFWEKDFADIEVNRDFYTGYAMFFGYILAVYLEGKFVNFNCSASMKTKAFRLLGAIVCVLLTQFGLKFVFPEGYILLDMLRYFLVAFVTLGLYPLIFKNILFKDEEASE